MRWRLCWDVSSRCFPFFKIICIKVFCINKDYLFLFEVYILLLVCPRARFNIFFRNFNHISIRIVSFIKFYFLKKKTHKIHVINFKMLASFLKILINFCWKFPHVVPMFKKDYISVTLNYKPVSLLSFTSKRTANDIIV